MASHAPHAESDMHPPPTLSCCASIVSRVLLPISGLTAQYIETMRVVIHRSSCYL